MQVAYSGTWPQTTPRVSMVPAVFNLNRQDWWKRSKFQVWEAKPRWDQTVGSTRSYISCWVAIDWVTGRSIRSSLSGGLNVQSGHDNAQQHRVSHACVIRREWKVLPGKHKKDRGEKRFLSIDGSCKMISVLFLERHPAQAAPQSYTFSLNY